MNPFTANLTSAGKGDTIPNEVNVIIIGTSNARNKSEAVDMHSQFPDLPLDGYIENAYYADGTSVLKPYTLHMNNVGDNLTQNYGYEYRMAKNILAENKAKKFNLLKVGIGGSRLAIGWQVGAINTNGLINAATASGKVWTICVMIGWENDATSQVYADATKTNLKALIAEIRDKINPDMEFYQLRMANFTASTMPYYSTVKTLTEEVANEDVKVTMFEPTWLVPNSDNFISDGLHYSVRGTDIIALKAIETIYN